MYETGNQKDRDKKRTAVWIALALRRRISGDAAIFIVEVFHTTAVFLVSVQNG